MKGPVKRRNRPKTSLAPLVIDGVMRPDLDRRHVTVSTMATYLGCSGQTLWRRTVQGLYKRGVINNPNGVRLYQPNLMVEAQP